jgi:hypothetical protein
MMPAAATATRRRPRRVVGALVCLAALGSGCEGTPPRDLGHTVTDSAGIRLVTSSRPAWDSGHAWVVDTAPLRAAGGDEGDSLAMLQLVAGAMRQSDGTLVVADRGSSQLKYFDLSGQLVRTVGRKGSGPGEFEYIAWLLACGGDSAFVADIGNRLVSVIAPDGRLVRRFRVETSEGNGTPFTTSCARSGRVVTTGWGDLRRSLRQQRPFRPEVPVDLPSVRDGGTPRTLGRFPGTEMVPLPGGGGPRAGGRWLHVGMGPNALWLAPNDGRGLLRYDSLGTLTLVARYGGGDPPLTAADARFLTRVILDSIPIARQRAQAERELALHPFPDRLPQQFALVVDAQGHPWVQRPPRAADPDPAWDVLSPEGVWLGSISLPQGARPLEIGADYLVAVRTGEHGGEIVAEYRVRR